MDYLSNDKMNIIDYPLIEPKEIIKAQIGGFFMQKNKEIYEILLSKREFVDILNRLQTATELVDKVEELFRQSRDNLENDFCNGAGLQVSHEGVVVQLLEKIMDDSGENISYFIYELDYGKEYKEGCISDDNGNIDISTAEKLYDFLVSEHMSRSDNSSIKK